MKKRRISGDIREESPYATSASPAVVTPIPAAVPTVPVPIPAVEVEAGTVSIPASPAFSRGSSLDRDFSMGPENGQKVLKIRRLVCITPVWYFARLDAQLLGRWRLEDGDCPRFCCHQCLCPE